MRKGNRKRLKANLGRQQERDIKTREHNRVLKPEFILTEEHQGGSNPLQWTHDVAEQNNGAEDGEELPCSGDDGAGQGPKVDHRHEDEGLVKSFWKIKNPVR